MKTFKNMVAALLVISASAMPIAAYAQSPFALSSDVKGVETSVDAAGNETTQLVEPGVIVPGKRLVLGTNYANDGEEAVANIVLDNPLPDAVRLAPDADPDLIVSVDAGDTWGTLSTLLVVGDSGASRSATHSDVTHVRLTIPSVAPGESGRLEIPVIVR